MRLPALFWIVAGVVLLATAAFGQGCTTGIPSSLSSLTVNVIPVNIVNPLAQQTPPNMPIMLSFNALQYSTVLSPTMNNIYGFNSLSNSIFPIWIEGNVLNERQTTSLNTVSNLILWTNLYSNTLSASGSANGIYCLGVGSTSTNFFIGQNGLGEAPQLSSTYAQYDNGNAVFNYYTNFTGPSLPASLQTIQSTSGSSSYTVSNGLSLSATGSTAYIHVDTVNQYPVNDIESYFSVLQETADGRTSLDYSLPTTSGGDNGYQTGLQSFVRGSRIVALTVDVGGSAAAVINGASVAGSTVTNSVYSIYFANFGATSGEVVAINYATFVSGTDQHIAQGPLYLGVAASNSGGLVSSLLWTRGRITEQNNVLPAISFGPIQAIQTYTPPSTPILANTPAASSYLDAGQTVLFTASFTGGSSPYTYNFLVVNSISNAVVTNMLTSNMLTSNSFTWTTTSAGTFDANVIVTDANPTTVNSVYTGIFTVNAAFSAAISPSKTNLVMGNPVTLNAVITGGTPPYALIWNSGISSTCALDGGITRMTSNQITISPFSSAYYCFTVTDSATTPVSVTSLAALVNVTQAGTISNPGGGGQTTSSVTTTTATTILTTSSYGTTTATTTIVQPQTPQACQNSGYLFYGFVFAIILIVLGAACWGHESESLSNLGILIVAIGIAVLILIIWASAAAGCQPIAGII